MQVEPAPPWNFHNPVKVHFGAGCRKVLAGLTGGQKLLVVTTARGRAQFVADPHLGSLQADLTWVDSVSPNPGLAETQAEIDRLAGQAFANAPVAAVHALAYPLGGNFHIPHGLSNALVLPQVLRFNVSAATTHYGELAPIILGDRLRTDDPSTYAEQLIEEFEQMSARVGLPTRLRDAGVPEEMLPQLAKEAMLQQRLLVNNPREVTEADALAIYQAAY